MLLSQESYRVRWCVLVAVWTLTAFYLFKQASAVGDYLTLVGRLGLRGAPAATTPMKEAYPAFAADAQVWVRHAMSLLEGNDVRLRYTTIDNAPDGREVHWNSAWAWTIAGAGKIHHLITGQPLLGSIERATIWLNPVVHFTLIVLLSAWATNRGGLIVGLLVVGTTVSSDRIYEGFFPGYVDHHGLLTLSVCGLVLGAMFMGGGWWQKSDGTNARILPASAEEARSAAVFSALCGALGLWVSAASVIPPVALVGIAALAANVLHGRSAAKQGATFDPEVWRLWGRVGAAASAVFYLLEYFPQHLSFRLEPNHPLHALAWLGGGELVAELSKRWLGRKEDQWENLKGLAWPLLAVGAVPAVIIIGGPKVFSVLDPFMSHLHNDYIQEFLPIWRTFRGFSTMAIIQTAGVGSLPLIAAIATLSYHRRQSSILLCYMTLAAFAFIALAVWQSRWLLNATGPQIALAIVVLAAWTVHLRAVWRWSIIVAAIAAFMIPGIALRYVGATTQLSGKQVSPGDANATLNRDIAAILRASQPQGEIVLLASPNASTGIAYYGRFKTLGTLYWENTAGLKAAASILGAQTEQEAATLIQKHKVTHIALVAQENFIEQYYRLLHPNAKDEDVRKCFGLKILSDKVVPQWLQMLPYSVPDDLATIKPTVMLFKVTFGQSMPEALYHVALAQIAGGFIDEGERVIDQLIKIAPQLPEPWLRKGELLFTRHAWAESAEHTLKGITLSAANVRSTLYGEAAAAFYKQNQHALAAQIYRGAIMEQATIDHVSYLGWILATSPDDSVRNAKDALQLAELAVKADPASASAFSVLSAALAENGRLPEAANAADRAVANSAIRKDAPGIQQEFADRLATLRAGKPLRFPVPAAPSGPAR